MLNYSVRSKDLTQAINNSLEGDISSLITSKDQNYSYLDSTCVISLQYQDISAPTEGYIRDYVLQSDGHYTLPGGGDNRSLGKSNGLQNRIENENPFTFKLFNNYPNPFNPVTSIKYNIPKDANVTLKIFDALGQLVTTLVNEYQKTGEYEVTFNGENYTSGVYFYVLESGNLISSKKMVLIK